MRIHGQYTLLFAFARSALTQRLLSEWRIYLLHTVFRANPLLAEVIVVLHVAIAI